MSGKNIIIADGHVHIHECFEIEKFLDSALLNFYKAAAKLESHSRVSAVLFLTESAGVDWFSKFEQESSNSKGIPKPSFGKWHFHPTNENNSLRAGRDEEQNLYLVAGRQVITAERLEVLALGIKNAYEDGQPIKQVIRQVIADHGLPVIPWGVGKWVGKRGKIVQDLVNTFGFSPMFLGDNGNRPFFWPRSPVFKKANKNAIRNLPGSDPLPFSSEMTRAGSFGFILPGSVDDKEPFKNMMQKLVDPEIPVETYGGLETPLRFIRNQLSVQFVKHLKGLRNNDKEAGQ